MFHIVFNADENYIKYTAVLMASIVKSTDTSKSFKDFFDLTQREDLAGGGGYEKIDFSTLSEDEITEGYVFHILSDELSSDICLKLAELEKELNKIYPCQIQTHIIDANMLKQSNLPEWKGGYQAHYRLFLASVLPKGIKTCLYLDTDMLVQTDVRELFTLNLKEKIAAVVPIFHSNLGWRKLIPTNPKFEDIKLPSLHFNSGFMLINLENWENKVVQKFYQLIQNYKPLTLANEPFFNAIIDENNRISLPLDYNFGAGFYNTRYPFCDEIEDFTQEYIPCTRDYFDKICFSPKIIHFIFVEDKPWQYNIALENLNLNERIKDYFERWWDVALTLPVFKHEFMKKTLLNNNTYISKLLQQSNDKINKMQIQININEEKRILTGAKFRIKNHLAYKLGQEMIQCSKYPLKYCTIGIALLNIARKHKKSLQTYQNLCSVSDNFKLPSLSSYADYEEALQIKEHLSYKLGEALIKASKTWYKGGYLLLIKDIWDAKIEYLAKKNKKEYYAKINKAHTQTPPPIKKMNINIFWECLLIKQRSKCLASIY